MPILCLVKRRIGGKRMVKGTQYSISGTMEDAKLYQYKTTTI